MIIPKTFKLTKKVLTRVATPIDFANPQLNQTLAERMLAFMHANNGIGLAAPQIGISKRLFVMQIDRMAMFCFNPKIVCTSLDFKPFDEGCLSFPGEVVTITRPKTIEIRYQNHRGDWTCGQLSGLASVCYQHELDHLDGIVMHDRR